MKMKQDPETEDGKTVKKAASAWIETTVTHKKKGDGQEEGEGGDKSGTVGQSAAAGAEVTMLKVVVLIVLADNDCVHSLTVKTFLVVLTYSTPRITYIHYIQRYHLKKCAVAACSKSVVYFCYALVSTNKVVVLRFAVCKALRYIPFG